MRFSEGVRHGGGWRCRELWDWGCRLGLVDLIHMRKIYKIFNIIGKIHKIHKIYLFLVIIFCYGNLF